MKFRINKHATTLKLLFHFLFYLSPVFLTAQTYKDNVVKLTAVYPDLTEFSSFGFIYAAENDLLYIVTTPGFLEQGGESDQPEIRVEYYNSTIFTAAKKVSKFRNNTCLLLYTLKPDNFVWNEKFCFATFVEKGNTVGIIGRYGAWNDFNAQTTGIIFSEAAEFTIDIPTQNPGLNGAPVIFNDCIAGLVLNDQGNQVTAVGYNTLQLYLDEAFKRNSQNDDRAYNLPYFLMGIKTGPFIRAASKIGSTLKFPDSYGWGFFLQTGITPEISIRYTRSYTNFFSFNYLVNQSYFQFRNQQTTNAFRLMLVIGDKFERADFNFFYEVGFNGHNPELRIDNSVWQRLDSYNEFMDSYSDKFASYCGGIEMNGLLTKNVLLGLELSVEKNRNKYLVINPIEPFETQKRNTWMLNLFVHTGIVLGNKEKTSRFLRPDKLNPFRINVFK